MYYAETGSTDPYYNLAFEEYILCHKRQGDWLILWQNANTVVVGMNQNTLEEIDTDFVKAHEIRVVRRGTGGGAVYHDLGNMNYSFIADAKGSADAQMAHFSSAVCGALSAMGVEAQATGRNDIVVQGKKVSGTAQRIEQGRILHHGTLLFRSDPQMIAGALRADPEKFRSKGTKSVESRVGNISDFLPENSSIEVFAEKLRESLTAGSFTYIELNSWEKGEISRLADSKYRTWEWNYGASPASTMKKRARYEGGTLEISAQVEQGRIAAIRFRGDFMARIALDPLEEALSGRRFTREEVASVLARFPLEDMFGAIKTQEVLDALFS